MKNHEYDEIPLERPLTPSADPEDLGEDGPSAVCSRMEGISGTAKMAERAGFEPAVEFCPTTV